MDTLLSLYTDRFDWFLELTWQHLYLSGIAIIVATVIGLFFGIAISEYKESSKFVLGFCNIIYTIPCRSYATLILA